MSCSIVSGNLDWHTKVNDDITDPCCCFGFCCPSTCHLLNLKDLDPASHCFFGWALAWQSE